MSSTDAVVSFVMKYEAGSKVTGKKWQYSGYEPESLIAGMVDDGTSKDGLFGDKAVYPAFRELVRGRIHRIMTDDNTGGRNAINLINTNEFYGLGVSNVKCLLHFDGTEKKRVFVIPSEMAAVVQFLEVTHTNTRAAAETLASWIFQRVQSNEAGTYVSPDAVSVWGHTLRPDDIITLLVENDPRTTPAIAQTQ